MRQDRHISPLGMRKLESRKLEAHFYPAGKGNDDGKGLPIGRVEVDHPQAIARQHFDAYIGDEKFRKSLTHNGAPLISRAPPSCHTPDITQLPDLTFSHTTHPASEYSKTGSHATPLDIVFVHCDSEKVIHSHKI